MKGSVLGVLVVVVVALPIAGVKAQDIGGVISGGITTVIRAVDLQVQRFQTKTIVLQEVQKAVENVMSALRLDEIRGWVQEQKDLYGGYFEELRQVKNVISGYHKVMEMIQRQEAILAAYQRGLGQFRQDPHFSAAELDHIETVFGAILAESARHLQELTTAIESFTLQVTDQQRMAMIDAASAGMDRNYRDLLVFSDENKLISLQRATDENDYSLLLKLYGL